MSERLGLRERKKDATRHRLMQAALDLFEERGFDEVSVAEIADAAEVSKKTVFNYFDAKEDLILGHAKFQIEVPAQLVRERPPGQTPHDALRQQWFERLAEHHPVTGLSDNPGVLRVIRLIHSTPQLMQRQMRYGYQSQQLLSQELFAESGSELSARLMASQIFGVRQELAVANFRGITAGATAAERYPEAVKEAELGFDLLENGLGNLLRREELYQRIPGYQPCGLTLDIGPLAVVM
ncbi:TetR/AcrR family transcriptional regulator [Stackebrandtia nassauensis]|uniref:Transcriptional regulator, TetR family n=1 Tax=Stackebrandtia nassauensis (strain DSM 44728 / CIP 108903 / NRRL B-16338 / NBRC 102104 / LLR-40K-21) TaxID=446470 RepID=D3Q423_STANL|nr:TetR/AcrR family transcriptional regulator [Stackebrandtia nassauensis]ADD45908.1 transcriptional regulator, TetR family [Stackebrandtia nassauensis DSM 44728]